MREAGRKPDFDRLGIELERAHVAWSLGNRGQAESILRMIGALAFSEAREQRPGESFDGSRT